MSLEKVLGRGNLADGGGTGDEIRKITVVGVVAYESPRAAIQAVSVI